jgi:hypothetical protein
MSDVVEEPPEALLEAIKGELARRDPELSRALLDTLLAYDADDDLDLQVWGQRPSQAEATAATVTAHRITHEARARVLAESLGRAGAAERLDVSPQHVSRLVDAGELVALADGGQLRLPAWQFHADTPRGRLEGIDVVARAHAGGPVTLSQWMTRPNPALAGRTPAEALADGEVDAVASAAREGV